MSNLLIPGRVFITGATGVLGKRVVKSLIERDIRVVALSRSAGNSSQLSQAGAEVVKGNLFNPEEMIEATKNCDAIFHLATHIPKKPIPNKMKDWKENDRIRTVGTKALLQAAVANNIKIFIQESVTILYGDKNGETVTSETPIAEEQIKWTKSAVEMENMIRDEKRTGHIILRFGSFYSEDSWNTTYLFDSVRKRRFPIIGKGDFYWNLISVDDAADAVVYSYQNFERLKNKTINFTDFSPILYKDFANGMAALTGSKKPFSIPLFIAKLLMGKEVIGFITNSYRVQQDDIIGDWKPKYKNCLEGMESILNNKKETINNNFETTRSL
jgi:nucleoside-diphosphate-sugar epimerase